VRIAVRVDGRRPLDWSPGVCHRTPFEFWKNPMKPDFAIVLTLASCAFAFAVPCPGRAAEAPNTPPATASVAPASAALLGSTTDRLQQSQRFSRLLGRAVVDRDGRKLGRIDDLVVDPASGRVFCLRVAPAGVYGDFHVLVPSPSFTAARAEFGAALGGNQTNLMSAPQVPNEVTNAEALANAVTNSCAYFGQPAPWGANGSPASLIRCSGLIGMPVRNTVNGDLGTVKDLTVDLPGGRIFFIVASFDGTDAGLYAVPPGAVSLDRDKGALVLDAARAKITFAAQQGGFIWEQMLSPAWAAATYRLYGQEPDFGQGPTEAAAGAESPNLFPRIEGSEMTVRIVKPAAESDGRITRDIVAAAAMEHVDGDGLQITTLNGRVTLAGRTRDADSKARLMEIAQRLAGVGNVDDQVEAGR
jgi:sporulation protein YlmC with PRC-barrel domain